MNDYIDRQAAIDAAVQSLMDWDGMFIQEANCRIRDAINELPSAQPGRKKGTWRDYPIADGCWQCSSCGVLRMGEPSNYCPNCGAKMDEEEQHEQN